jgi:hypothetical protein
VHIGGQTRAIFIASICDVADVCGDNGFCLRVPSLTPSVHRQSPLFVELTQTKTKRLFSKNKFAQRHVMLLLYLFQ